MEYKITILKKRVKNLRITVKRSSEVVVSAPWFYTKWQIMKIVESKESWILWRLRYFEKSKGLSVIPDGKIMYLWKPYDYEFAEKDYVDIDRWHIKIKWNSIDAWHKKQAKEYIAGKVYYFSDKFGFNIGKLSFRNQKSRWWSCSQKNNISLNITLMKCPPEIIDYVILHELVHTIEKNHSKKFWDKLSEYYPDYSSARKWLRTAGKSMILF